MNDKPSELHDKLLEEFRLYFNANQIWVKKQTHLSGIAIRKHLSAMSKICIELRAEIQKIRDAKPKVKSPEYRKSLLQDQTNKKDT